MQKTLRNLQLYKPTHDQVVLLHLARRMKVRNRRQAIGRCFGASFACAALAHKKGVRVLLIRWKVVNDKAYADHWAIRFSDDLAMDLTSAQFDSHAAVLRRLDAYPINFLEPMEYPFEIFLKLLGSKLDICQLTTRSMLGVYARLFFYDAAKFQDRKIKWNIGGAGLRFLKECLSLVGGELGRWARRRKVGIQERGEIYDLANTAPVPLK
jgi:hypothetical protein